MVKIAAICFLLLVCFQSLINAAYPETDTSAVQKASNLTIICEETLAGFAAGTVSGVGAGLLTVVVLKMNGESSLLIAMPIIYASYILGSSAGVSHTAKEFSIKNSFILTSAFGFLGGYAGYELAKVTKGSKIFIPLLVAPIVFELLFTNVISSIGNGKYQTLDGPNCYTDRNQFRFYYNETIKYKINLLTIRF